VYTLYEKNKEHWHNKQNTQKQEEISLLYAYYYHDDDGRFSVYFKFICKALSLSLSFFYHLKLCVKYIICILASRSLIQVLKNALTYLYSYSNKFLMFTNIQSEFIFYFINSSTCTFVNIFFLTSSKTSAFLI
jgi:hypothetical protein